MMINKQSIYYWFFFPLLALLSAGSLTSCIYDSVLEETDMSGKSTLSITMRGVTINPDNGYDEYIKTLRIIVFDASGLICNKFYSHDDIAKWEVKGSSPNTYYDITQELQNFSGGNCRFYFIANEEGYNIYNNATPTSLYYYLNSTDLTEAQLKECIVASTPDTEDWSKKPILMIANPSAQYIKPGDNIEIADVKLVRCVAKVQLIVKKDNTITDNANVTVSNVSLHGSRPDSYTLWENGTVINGINYSKTLLSSTASSTVGSDSPYSSDMVYFPEMLYQDNTTEGNLYFTFTLTYGDNATENTYTIAIGDDANDDGVVEDYNIYRNTVYTVTATLQWQPTEPTMNIQVDAWDEKEMSVEFN